MIDKAKPYMSIHREKRKIIIIDHGTFYLTIIKSDALNSEKHTQVFMHACLKIC